MILLAKAKVIGGIVQNLIAVGIFLVPIGYFALTGKMAEMFGWKNNNRYRSYRLTWCKMPKIYGDSLTIVSRSSMA